MAKKKSNKNYFSRLIDAAGEAMEAGERYVTNDAAYRNAPLPMKTPEWRERVERDEEARRQERGQYFGALLQGRQYDSQGNQIKKKSDKKKK